MRLVLLAAGLALAAPQSRWSRDADPPGRPMLWLDTDQSSLAGADNIISLNGSLGRLEDRLLPVRLFENDTRLRWAASVSYRFAKLTFLDLVPAAFLPLLQHEVYGHGHRAREAGFENINFELNTPPPYGPGDGSTSWSYADSLPPGPDQDITMAMAGIEATDILSQRLRGQWLQDRSMDYHAAFLYLFSCLGLPNYLAVTGKDELDQSNDVVGYVADLNKKTGNTIREEYWVNLSDLEDGSKVAFADPFLYYSAWTVLRYLFSGETQWRYLALPLGPVRYLPSLGFRLSPFGGQTLVENLATWGPRSFNLRIAYGDGKAGTTRGADLEGRDLLAWSGFSLDAALRTWSQPELWLDADDPKPGTVARTGFGAQFVVTSPPVSDVLPIRLALGVAGKSTGYVPGERLDGGPTFRLGFGMYK